MLMKIATLHQRERGEEGLGYLGTRVKETGRWNSYKCFMKIPSASTKVYKKPRLARQHFLIRTEHTS